jgi:MSHA pilin protein MshD
MKAPASEAGFSLIEIVLTIAIIGVALTVMIAAWAQMAKRTGDPFFQAKAAFLGQAYIEEILTKRYDENTPVGGLPACISANCSSILGPDTHSNGSTEPRSLFDDVDDYNGLVEAPSENALGVVRPEYDSYQVSITVSYAVGDFSRPTHTAKRIDVLVTPPGETALRFTAYRGNY